MRALRAELAEGRARSDAAFRIVKPKALTVRPISERHRLLFYVGHVEAFDWNLLHEALDLRPFHASFDRLFAFGIDPVEGNLPTDQVSDWPSVPEIQEYVREARRALDDALERRTVDEVLWNVAIEHRLMHVETLAYAFHRLPFEDKVSEATPPIDGPVPERRPLAIPAGRATLGRKRGAGFGWDNEFEEHVVDVPGFLVDSHPVTNAAWLAFVNDGGPPASFWVKRGDTWMQRTMFADVTLPLSWPVYVSHEMAAAYAAWAGRALPTEAEFHRAAFGTPQGSQREYPWGDVAPDSSRGRFDFSSWDPAPVGAHPAGASAFGVGDLVGNGWEWTQTSFTPLPGFERFSFYPGYSADFFDGKHFVLKGASQRTAARLLRRSFRNWFQPHYPHVYAKFRLVTR